MHSLPTSYADWDPGRLMRTSITTTLVFPLEYSMRRPCCAVEPKSAGNETLQTMMSTISKRAFKAREHCFWGPLESATRVDLPA